MLNVTINELLYLLIYKNTTTNTIKRIVNILNISKSIVTIEKENRKYERVRKRPSTIWCQYGNKYKNVKRRR